MRRPASTRSRLHAALLLGAVGVFGGCQREPAATPAPEVTGALSIAGAPARLVRCRPGHGVHVFVEVDTSAGTLRFGDGKLYWQGSERSCAKLDRRWGGGIRRDGSAYFRGTLALACGDLTADLALDCGHVTPDEARELTRNADEARARARRD